MLLFVWENTKHIVRASTVIDRVCKRCYLCSCKNRLFVFCLISLAHMGRWSEASDVYQKSNWGGTGSCRLEKRLYLWSWGRLGIPHRASVSLMRFLGWAVSVFHKGDFLSKGTSEIPLPALPPSEWCCGMPEDVLPASQLLPRCSARAHCWPVL